MTSEAAHSKARWLKAGAAVSALVLVGVLWAGDFLLGPEISFGLLYLAAAAELFRSLGRF